MAVFTIDSSASTRGPGSYVRIRSAQLNSRALGRVFKLDPDCLYLVSENGNVELPDERGLFDVDCMDNSLVWSCEGSSPQRTRPREAIRRCVPPVCESAWIKIIHVCDFDGLLLRKICNLPVPLTEQSASVASVSQFVSQEAFGGGAVVLLDWENLKIPDTVRTRGSYIATYYTLIACACQSGHV